MRGNTIIVNMNKIDGQHYLQISGCYESDPIQYIPENNCQLSNKVEHGIFSFINRTNLKK